MHPKSASNASFNSAENSAKAHAYAAEKPFFLCTRNIGFDDFSAVMN